MRPGCARSRWALPLLTLLVVGGCLGCGQPAVPPAAVIEEFPCYGDGDGILVPVSIAGTERPFLLDTGAQWTCLDTDLEPLAGAPLPERTSVNGVLKAKTFPWPELRMGRMEVSLPAGAKVVALPLDGIREASGHECAGVLGFDWLCSQIVRVDFANSRVQFLREPPTGEGLPLEIVDGKAFAQIQLADCGYERLMIDTGCLAGGVYLAPDQFARLQESNAFTRIGQLEHGSYTLAGNMPTELGVIDYIKLGNDRYSNVVIRSHAGRSFGVLGLEILSKRNVTFDFPNQRMYFDGPSLSDKASSWNRSGLTLIRREKRTLVESVEPDSPGHIAGIQAGDELLTMAGQDVGKLRLFTIYHLLGARRRLPLELKRGSLHFNVALELTDWPAAQPRDRR